MFTYASTKERAHSFKEQKKQGHHALQQKKKIPLIEKELHERD
jgi:hypothetical protein